MRKTVFLLSPVALLAALALASPAWCGAGEIRRLTVELDTAKDAIFLPDSSTLRDKTLTEFTRKPPGPGWADWSVSDLPSFSHAYDVLELLRAADVLGFLDRRDATARKVLLEIAGRIRDTGREDTRWLARTSRWIQASVSIPRAKDMVANAREKGPGIRRLLARLKAVLRAEALAGGPPPKGRPVLAEGFEAYRRLMRDSEAILHMIRDLEERHGPAVPRDWRYRVESTRRWAMYVADTLGLSRVAGLSEDSPQTALEYVDSEVLNIGRSFDGIIMLTCAQDFGQDPCPEAERPVADALRKMADSFFDNVFNSYYALYEDAKRWLHSE